MGDLHTLFSVLLGTVLPVSSGRSIHDGIHWDCEDSNLFGDKNNDNKNKQKTEDKKRTHKSLQEVPGIFLKKSLLDLQGFIISSI